MQIRKIKETCLYVSDLERTKKFYTNILGLQVISFVPGQFVFFRAGQDVLLCFDPQKSGVQSNLPAHFASGKIHLAFEVDLDEYEAWKKKLMNLNIQVTQEVNWKNDRKSFYFEDPDGHVLEILPPGIWE